MVSFNSSTSFSSGITLGSNSTVSVNGTLTIVGDVAGDGTIQSVSLNATGVANVANGINFVASNDAIFSSLTAGRVTAPIVTVSGTLGGTAAVTVLQTATVTGTIGGTARITTGGIGATQVFANGGVSGGGVLQANTVTVANGISGIPTIQSDSFTLTGGASGSPTINTATGSLSGPFAQLSLTATQSATLTGSVTGGTVTINTPQLTLASGLQLNSGRLQALQAGSRVSISGVVTGPGTIETATFDATGVTALSADVTISAQTLGTIGNFNNGTVSSLGNLNITGTVSGSAVAVANTVATVVGVTGSASVTGRNMLTVTGAVSGSPSLTSDANIVLLGSVSNAPRLFSPTVTVRGTMAGSPVVPQVSTVRVEGSSATAVATLQVSEAIAWPQVTLELANNAVLEYVVNTNSFTLGLNRASLLGGALRVTVLRALAASECLTILRPNVAVTTLFANLPPYAVAYTAPGPAPQPQLWLSYSGGAGERSVQLSGPNLLSLTLPSIRIPEGSIDRLNTLYSGPVATLAFCPELRLQINTIIDWGSTRQIQNNVQLVTNNQLLGRKVFTGDAANGPSVSNYTITAFVSLNSGAVSQNVVVTGSVIVDNIVPAIAVTAPNSAVGLSGSPINVTLSNLVDPGNDFVTGYTINWGDNTRDAVTCTGTCVFPASITHTYAALPVARAYLIVVDLLDNDGYWESVGSLVTTQTAFVAVGPTGAPGSQVPLPPPTGIPPTSVPVPPAAAPTSAGPAPTSASSVGGNIFANGYPLVYSLSGIFNEFVPNVAGINVTIPNLAGRTVQFVGVNVLCGSAQFAGSDFTQQVKLLSRSGTGIFDFSKIAGGQSLKLCAMQTDGRWVSFSDVSLQTISVTSIRFDGVPVNPTAASKREVQRSVLIPRQTGVTGVLLRTLPTMQVGDSYSFAVSAADCATGPSPRSTDITTVGTSKLDFSQVPSRTILSPCIRKAGYAAWSFFPYSVVGVVEPQTGSDFEQPSIEVSESSAAALALSVVLGAIVLLLNIHM